MTLQNINTERTVDVDFASGDKIKNIENKIRLNIINTRESLDKVAEEWRTLASAADVPVYLTYEWLSRWWEFFGSHPKRKLFVVTIYNGPKLIGFAPFFMGISSIGPVTLQKRINLMGSGVNHNELLGFADDYGYSDFLDIIVHPDYKKNVADHLIKLLRLNPMNIDVLCFQHVSDESFVMNHILPRLENRAFRYELEHTDECPYITLPDSMDEYKKNQLGSSSRRRRFRKNLKPVDDKYPVERATSWKEVKRRLDILYNLHQERWNSLGYPGAFFDEKHYKFLIDMCKAALENGWLWFVQARDEERYGAVRLALKYEGRYYDWASGFDITSSISKYRPGLGLLSLMVKEGIEEKASRIELLRGDERYKFDFTRESRNNWRLKIPVYVHKKSSFAHQLLEYIAKVYCQLQREWTLLKVQYQEKGPVRMFYSYFSFRMDKISEKLEEMNLFSRSD